jgi:hypothetical protein
LVRNYLWKVGTAKLWQAVYTVCTVMNELRFLRNELQEACGSLRGRLTVDKLTVFLKGASPIDCSTHFFSNDG